MDRRSDDIIKLCKGSNRTQPDWIHEIGIPRQLRQGLAFETPDKVVHVEPVDATLDTPDGKP